MRASKERREFVLKVTLSRQMLGLLEELHGTGLYGFTVEETARRLLEEDLWARIRPEDKQLRLGP